MTGVVKVRDKEEGLRPVWGISLSVLNLQTLGSPTHHICPRLFWGWHMGEGRQAIAWLRPQHSHAAWEDDRNQSSQDLDWVPGC